jgi:sulfur-oxidizing protein SoxZ
VIPAKIQAPASAKKGETIEIRVLVQHPMETGFRRDMNGQSIPINIVKDLTCRIGGREVFSAELGSGMSANPYLVFYAVAQESGEIVVDFVDDRGDKGRASASIVVA